MTLYSRSDLVAVTVPAEGFRGCGQLHTRPVVDGAPAKIWALDCPPCEDHLRHDAHWSATTTEVPETYDEKLVRERDEKMGKLDRENQLAEALIELGKLGKLPDALLQVVSPVLGALNGTTVCPAGHDNAPGGKFCAQCGAHMHGAANALEAPQAQASVHHTAPDTGDMPGPAGKKRRLRDERLDVLQQMARERGLSAEGTRADLLDRLKAAPAAA